MALYTPFFEKAAANVGNAVLENQAQDLTKRAYLGDQEALGQLYRVNPQAAQQIQQQQRQQVQTRLAISAEQRALADDQREIEDRARDWAIQQEGAINQIEQDVANIDDFESAREYFTTRLDRLGGSEFYDAEKFTPELYQSIRAQYGPQSDPNKPFNADGTPNEAYQAYEAGKGRDPVRTQKIEEVSRQLLEMGVPEQEIQAEASNVVDGRIRYEVTDQGNVLKINEVSGQTEEVPIGGPVEPVEPSTNDQQFSLYGMSNQTSGVEPTLKALGAKVSAMFGMEAFPETVTSRQIAEGATQGLVRALSINDQYPVREIERIRTDMAKIGPSLFSGGPETRAQMKGLHTLMSNTLMQAQRDSQNPQMPTDIRAGAARAANDIANFLDIMGYVDTDILKSPEVVMQTPLASLEEYIRVTDEEELNKLPEDVEIAIYERFSNAPR